MGLVSYHGGDSERDSERVTALLPVEKSSSHVAKAVGRKTVNWSQHTTGHTSQRPSLHTGKVGMASLLSCAALVCCVLRWDGWSDVASRGDPEEVWGLHSPRQSPYRLRGVPGSGPAT